MAADFCEEYYIYGRKNYGLCQGEFQGTELGSADHSLKAVCSGREHRGGQDQRKGSAEAGVSGFERDLGIAEEKRRTIRQRQKEGIDAAKARGQKFGRKDKGFPEDWEIYYPRYRSGELKRA